MKRNYLIISGIIICSTFLFLFHFGANGTSTFASERVIYLIGKWKGTCSFSVSSTGFTPKKASLVLQVSEQLNRNFIGYIEGSVDGIPYRMELTGAIDGRDRNIFAIDKSGTIYTGYFVTSHRMMLYSFENRGNPRIIQYKLRKYSDI